jgi:hypothetical protein
MYRCLVLCVSLGSLSGCSFLFVHSPPAQHAQLHYFDCTSSKAAPVIDTVVAGLEAVRTGVAISASEGDYAGYPISRGADIGFGLGLTALFTAAAIYGYNATGDCADAKEALERRAEEAPEMGPGPPPGAPPPPMAPQCSYDAQCKGNRICEAGRCATPQPPAALPAPAAPAPDAPPTPGPEQPPGI